MNKEKTPPGRGFRAGKKIQTKNCNYLRDFLLSESLEVSVLLAAVSVLLLLRSDWPALDVDCLGDLAVEVLACSGLEVVLGEAVADGLRSLPELLFTLLAGLV